MPTYEFIYTVGELARRLAQPLHRIQYFVKARQIRPVGRVGNLRVFDENAVDAIAQAIQDADRRTGKEVTSDVR